VSHEWARRGGATRRAAAPRSRARGRPGARGSGRREGGCADGGGHEALQQVAVAGHDQREADAPHARAHQVHPQQPGHQEVHVARPGLGDLRASGLEHVVSTGRPLQRRVDGEAGGAAVGLGRVERVLGHLVRGDHQHHPAPPQGLAGLVGGEPLHVEVRVLRERVQARLADPFHDGNGKRLRGAVPECQSQHPGEEDGEDEHPEDGLGLPHELLQAGEGQLHQGAADPRVTHPAGSSR